MDDATRPFDFIVVGGGDAGLVLARRLATADTAGAVALVEAGVRATGLARRVWPWPRPARSLAPALWSVPQPGLNGRVIELVDAALEATTTEPAWGADPLDARIQLWSAALASRLRFDGKRCTGVEVMGRSGRARVLAARREVLLCAGALGNAHLLQVSGVGDGAALQKAGIRFKHHLPGVGANLQDRLGFTFRHALADKHSLDAVAACGLPPDLSGVQWQIEWGPQDGPRQRLPPWHRSDTLCLRFHLVDPGSRGMLKSQGPDVREPPRIDPGHFDDPGDVERMAEALQSGRNWLARIARNVPLGRDLITEGVAGDLAEREALRDRACSLGHFVGTCRMGSDPDAVVDGQMRVHGLQGVRVADASVLPSLQDGEEPLASALRVAGAVARALSDGDAL